MQFYTAVVVLGLLSLAASAPVPRPAGTLEGVVDGVAPITAGLGTTLNGILGFKDAAGGSSGSNSGSSGDSKTSGGTGSNSGSGGSSAGGSALLGGVVDSVAPITGGLGQTLNGILGFH